MPDFLSQISALFDKFRDRLAQLRDLGSLYQQTIGKKDLTIEERIERLSRSSKEARGQFEQYHNLMKLSDMQLLALNSNERLHFEDDLVYRTSTGLIRSKFENRSLTESEYWSAVFKRDTMRADEKALVGFYVHCSMPGCERETRYLLSHDDGRPKLCQLHNDQLKYLGLTNS